MQLDTQFSFFLIRLLLQITGVVRFLWLCSILFCFIIIIIIPFQGQVIVREI